MQMRRLGYLFMLVITITLSATASFAQDGKLKIKVTPAQAYVFADGKAIREGSHSIPLSAGKHTILIPFSTGRLRATDFPEEPVRSW